MAIVSNAPTIIASLEYIRAYASQVGFRKFCVDHHLEAGPDVEPEGGIEITIPEMVEYGMLPQEALTT